MFSNKSPNFKCGLSSEKNQHFVMMPIEIPCGHLICKSCIPPLNHVEDNIEYLQCQICLNGQSSETIKNIIGNNFDQLSNELRAQFKTLLASLKGNAMFVFFYSLSLFNTPHF